MALEAGRRLGHFDVLAPLGAGGMGEVYRARDNRLGREVALKLLPETLTRDSERRARLEREARALAALSHPGIAAIHGLEEHEGTPVLVMEMVEGETLDKRLERGRLSLRQALDLGRQMADALAVAHEKGIIHRDLKPSNIGLTPEGHVKLLDFGLAKALATTGAESGEPGSPVTGSTATGIMLGTAPYMSPEQVRGEPLDRRTDIWSFGCVLYELLAGGRAFPGHAPESIVAVLEREPDWQALPPETPLEVQQLLRHCLQKDRARRLHDVADARLELEEVLADLATGRERAKPVVGATTVGWLRRLALAGLVLGVLAATHAGAIFWARRTAEPRIPLFTRITFQRGTVDSARFSPDGQTVVYSARWQGGPSEVFSQRLGSADARPFGLAGARVVAVAGAETAVILAGGTLARVPLEGGSPREVLSDVADADWRRDGAEWAIVRYVGLGRRLEWPAGTVLRETAGIESIDHPRISPAGDRIAFISRLWWGANLGDVVVADRSGRRQVLSSGWEDAGGLAWSADGRELWFSASRTGMTRALHAVTLSGHERLVARGTGSLILQDVSSDRVLLADARRRAELRGRMAGDAAERDLSWLDGTNTAILSPDGTRLVFEEWGEAGGFGSSTYVRRMDGSPAVRLGDGWPVDVSPDWKTVLCRVGYRYPNAELRLVPIGPGEPRTLPRGSIRDYSWAFFFPDGKRIVVRANEEGRATRIFLQRLPDGLPEPLSAEGVAFLSNRPVSPDGRFVVARAPGHRGPWALYPVNGGDLSLITGLGVEDGVLGWSEDGRALFAVENRADFPARVLRFDLRTRTGQPWLEFLPPNRDGVASYYNATITPDGRSYAYSYERTLSDLYVVEDLK